MMGQVRLELLGVKHPVYDILLCPMANMWLCVCVCVCVSVEVNMCLCMYVYVNLSQPCTWTPCRRPPPQHTHTMHFAALTLPAVPNFTCFFFHRFF